MYNLWKIISEASRLNSNSQNIFFLEHFERNIILPDIKIQ